MIKRAVILSLTFLFVGFSASFAQNAPNTSTAPQTTATTNYPTTSDLNHKGWHLTNGKFLRPVGWQDLSTDCKPCKWLVLQFNDAADNLLYSRYLKERNRRRFEDAKKSVLDRAKKGEFRGKTDAESVQNLEAALLVEELEYGEREKILDQRIRAYANLAARLRNAIVACEAQCKPGANTTGLTLDSPRTITEADANLPAWGERKPPITFDGPYPAVCPKCQKAAQDLNRVARKMAEAMNRIVLLENLAPANETPLSRRERESAIKNQRDLVHDTLKKQFEAALKKYEDCIKTCPEDQPTDKRTGYRLPLHEEHALVIGPNDKVGTGAARADRLTGAVKGAATRALTGALGLGGGRSSRSSGSSGPKTARDPARRNDFARTEVGEADVGFRGAYTENGFVISSRIFDAPGDGTFHAQWIEDANGEVYLPNRYEIYSLYKEWTLTVSWTRDTYVNGQHVDHAAGGWTESWTEDLGSFTRRFEGEEGAENSIWRRLGFDNASKGVDGLGAYYDIPREVLAGPYPLRVVTHISKPEEDPVPTFPVIAEIAPLGDDILTAESKKDYRNLTVDIEPDYGLDDSVFKTEEL